MAISSSVCFWKDKIKISPSIHHIYALNIMMKAVKELCQIPPDKDAKGLIKK